VRATRAIALPATTPPHAAQSTTLSLEPPRRLASRVRHIDCFRNAISGISTSVVTPPAARLESRSQIFPLRAAGLIDVHVRIHQAGKQHMVAEIEELRACRHFIPAAKRSDPLVVYNHCGGCDAIRRPRRVLTKCFIILLITFAVEGCG